MRLGVKKSYDVGVPNTSKKRRKWRKIMWFFAGGIILIALIVCIGISVYVGNSMTHPEKKPIDQFPSDYGMDYEDIEFVSRDGETDLSGRSEERRVGKEFRCRWWSDCLRRRRRRCTVERDA